MGQFLCEPRCTLGWSCFPRSKTDTDYPIKWADSIAFSVIKRFLNLRRIPRVINDGVSPVATWADLCTKLCWFYPLLWLKGQLKHLGLRSYPSISWYSLLSFFTWVFPSLLNSLIIPMVYWLLALKRLSLTLHTALATVLFLFYSSQWQMSYISKRRE